MPARSSSSARQSKMIRLTLTSAEWRTLRVWAAEDDSSMQAVVAQIVQSAIARRARRIARGREQRQK
jgi:hypothetical protein